MAAILAVLDEIQSGCLNFLARTQADDSLDSVTLGLPRKLLDLLLTLRR